jgi:hypothetical protein
VGGQRSVARAHCTYAFSGGRRAEEEVVLRQRPQLAQESWSFRELQGGKPSRAFTVDLRTGARTAMKEEKGETKRWSEMLDVVDGQTFAGFGFSLAIKALRERLIKGEEITLKGIGFAPKPQLVSVELSYGGRDRIRMAAASSPQTASSSIPRSRRSPNCSSRFPTRRSG